MLSTITRITRVLTAVAIALGFAVSAHAQAINTAPLSGVVSTQTGQPIAGAKITILHQPTATVTRVTTNALGRFERGDLRPGGPYTVAVEAAGFGPSEMNEIFLAAESGAHVTIAMAIPDLVTLEKYTVTANAASAMFDPSATDKSSFISNRDIQNMVASDRTLGSLLANDPRITYNRNPEQQYISVSGINNRYNQMMVDGVSVQDPYGLNANGLAAQNNVIPIEAIESIALSTSPYNVRKGGFTGAYVNAVTKSGGNEFHGSVYYTFRSQELAGEHLDGVSAPLANFKEQTFGGSLGGPIVPGKVFFFASVEQKNFNKPMPTPAFALSGSTMTQLMNAITQLNSGTAQNGNIINAGASVPFDVGTTNGQNNKTVDTVGTAKVDWQVNSNHRLTLGYQYSKGTRPTYPAFAGSSQSSINNFSFSNSWYDLNKKSSAITAAWTAQWTDNLYTEVNVGYKKYDVSNTNDPIQPYVQIQGVPVITPTGTSSSAYVTWGTDRNYQTNSLNTKTKTGELFASYKLGNSHTLDAGLQYNTTDVFNKYVASTAGYYVFGNASNGWKQFLDYVAGTSKSIMTYNYNGIGTKNIKEPGFDPAASFTEANLGVFVRDVWRVGRSLTLDINLRLDDPIISDKPAFNKDFYESAKLRTYYNNSGFRNDSTYDGQMVLQPRIGFNWQPKINDGKLKTVVRGGGGLFYGGMPRVWLGNSYSNTGFNYTAYTQSSGTNVILSSDPNKQQTSNVGVGATQTVNFVDSDFKLPTRWKANIAIEQELPWWGMKFTAEVEGSVVENDVFYKAINIKSNSFSENTPDGRPMYWSAYISGIGSRTLNTIDSNFSASSIQMTNANEGHTLATTFSIERPMKADGWQWLVAYTNTQTIEATYGNSSVALSNWNGRSVFDPNAVEPHRGDGEIRDRFLVNITKQLNFFSFGATTFTLTYNGRSGLPYSIVAYNDVNGDGQYNDVMYVPGRNEISVAGDGNSSAKYVFSSVKDRDNFYTIAKKYGLTEGARTTVNGQRYPWVNQFDVHLAQQVKLPGWRHSLELAIDVLNIGNLLNDKWGLVRGMDEAYVKSEQMATVVYNNTDKKYLYSAPRTVLLNDPYFKPWLDTAYAGEPAASRWSILLSARYKF